MGRDTGWYRKTIEGISAWSIRMALTRRQRGLISRLRAIVPDLTNHYTRTRKVAGYLDSKLRASQSFQCMMMLKALEPCKGRKKVFVVDVGDCSGTHMVYLKELAKGDFEVDTLSVNLDPSAIGKIREKGLKAVLCRAEDLDLAGSRPDLVTAFSTLEHLHNPALFLRRLAKRVECERVLITVPYLRQSRVGLHFMRKGLGEKRFAEDEHIFELKPADWELLFLHSGWKVEHSRVYYQYPRGIPLVSGALAWFWRHTDWEGFWGVILRRDTAVSDQYQDWEDK